MNIQQAIIDFIKLQIKDTKYDQKVYIAGGYVRDTLLKKDSKDIDLTIDEFQGGIKFSEWITKKLNINSSSNPLTFPNFGTSKFNFRGIKHNGIDISTIDIECVSPRKEKYLPGNRKPIVSPGTIEDDVYRRDFTVNSLLYNISTGKIVDITGKGLVDLKLGIIRTTKDPDLIFKEDGLRLLRAIRFQSKYGWDISDDTLRALRKNASQIENISMERVQEEFNKIFKTDGAGRAFKLIRNTGLTKYIFPEVNITDEKIKLMQGSKNPALKIAILFHDLSKPQIEQVLKRLKYPNHVVNEIANAVNLKTFFDDSFSDQKIREFRRVAGKNADITLQLIDALNMPVDVDKIRSKLQQMQNTPIKPPVNGNDLIQLGVKPGPRFKELLDIAQKEFERNPAVSKQELIDKIKSQIF